MLREIKNTRQIPSEPNRRWFNSEEMDLFIWHQADSIIGFQLCYDKSGQERALTWKPDTGLIHEKVDNGESRDGRYKATPILLKNGTYDIDSVISEFLSKSERLSYEIKDFVLQKLIK